MHNEAWPSTQVSLLEAIRNPHDVEAWRLFVKRYRGPIVAHCCRRFRMQEAMAEDVAQNILLKLVRVIRQFQYDAAGSFRGWLKMVTRHAVIDLINKEGRRVDQAAGGSAFDRAMHGIPAENDDLVEAASRQLRRDLLHQAEQAVRLRIKNPGNWEAYAERKSGKSAREVASKLDITVAAVHKARSRILEMIREEIARMLRADSTTSPPTTTGHRRRSDPKQGE